ncbi:MAG TPA: hypothetical protein VK747_07670, partial [Blastocatellia bacterium]|nr:hypothetical protein [Blastocatellia bacterium]
MIDPASQADKNRTGHLVLLFLLFFLICFGLGYPTLKRYDPRAPGNNSDSTDYYAMVTGDIQQANFRSYRVLVPYSARPLYRLADGHVGQWDPVFLSLLIINSMFTAAAALFLISIGHRVTGDYGTALLGAMIYLVNFAIANFQLAGLVDSGEAFFMMTVAWTLVTRRWPLLPLLAIPGAMAKETFVPFSVVFAAVWLMTRSRTERKVTHAGWIVAMGVAGVATIIAVQSSVTGHLVYPWQLEVAHASLDDYLARLVGCFRRHEFWYVFGWLLPLGIWRLRDLPRE